MDAGLPPAKGLTLRLRVKSFLDSSLPVHKKDSKTFSSMHSYIKLRLNPLSTLEEILCYVCPVLWINTKISLDASVVALLTLTSWMILSSSSYCRSFSFHGDEVNQAGAEIQMNTFSQRGDERNLRDISTFEPYALNEFLLAASGNSDNVIRCPEVSSLYFSALRTHSTIGQVCTPRYWLRA